MKISFPIISALSLLLSGSVCPELTDSQKRDALSRTTIEGLLTEYERQPSFPSAGYKIVFEGVKGKDVYNPTAPFVLEGKTIIAGRVESRDSETDTQVRFFSQSGTRWKLIEGAPTFKLQDPFVTVIDGELVLGGVDYRPGVGYKTVFLRGNSLSSLKQFAEGPSGMKDIRLSQFEGGILVMTRPQGDRPGAAVQPGKGKIGFTVIRKLSELTADVIEQAPILDELFVKSEWGGANELHYLGNNIFGVLGHIAKFDAQDNRHYYSIAFRFNLATKMISNLKIVAARKDIANGLQGASKRPDLNDVIFSGGIVRRGKIYDLYLGAGDAEVIVQPISEPF